MVSPDREDAPTGLPAPGSGSDAVPTDRPETLVADRGTGAMSRLRLTRPGPNWERLEEEYGRVVNLMDAIQKHLASQDERSDMMVSSLDRLAENFKEMPQASRRHLDLLSGISEAVQADAASTKHVEEALSQLPQLADAQRETMVSIGRQLDLSRQTSEQVAGTMEGFQQAVTRLSETTEASSKALQEMRWDATAREERVATLLQKQTRWLLVFAWSAIALAAIAAVVGLIAILR